MFTKGVIVFVLTIIRPIISKIQVVEFSASGLELVLSWVNGVLYFLPMGTVNMILGIIFTTMIFRIVISVLKTIWGILPIL